jgi:hypothetical protein
MQRLSGRLDLLSSLSHVLSAATPSSTELLHYLISIFPTPVNHFILSSSNLSFKCSAKMYACVSVPLKTIEILDVGAGLGPIDLQSFTSYFQARSQNLEKRLLASSCPSVCRHGTTWLPLDGFWLNLVFELFSKIYRENSSPLKFYKNNGYFTRRRFHVYNNISLNFS